MMLITPRFWVSSANDSESQPTAHPSIEWRLMAAAARTVRDVLLKVHLVLGLVAATFLLILGATGTIMAFEHDIERWIDPALWRASVAEHRLSEDALVAAVQAQFAPAHVVSIQLSPRADVVRVLRMSDQASVYIDQWSGRVTRRVVGTTRVQDWIGYVHQLHLRLVPNPRAAPRWVSTSGKLVVSWAGPVALQPTGLCCGGVRSAVREARRRGFDRVDAHHAIGLQPRVLSSIRSHGRLRRRRAADLPPHRRTELGSRRPPPTRTDVRRFRSNRRSPPREWPSRARKSLGS